MKHRLTLEFDDEFMENLLRLKRIFGVKTLARAISRSMAVANYAIQQSEESDYIVVMRGDKQTAEDEIRVNLLN